LIRGHPVQCRLDLANDRIGLRLRSENEMDLVDVQQLAAQHGLGRRKERSLPPPFKQKGKDIGVMIEITVVEGEPNRIVGNRLFSTDGGHDLLRRDDGVATCDMIELSSEFVDGATLDPWIA
jgi:hypothetical protein